MTNTSISKIEQAISKLVEKTQDNEIKWNIVSANEYIPKIDTEGVVLHVNYLENDFLLFRKAFFHMTNYPIAGSALGDFDKYYKPMLCIINIKNKIIIYTFPDSELIIDLYKAATYYAAHMDTLISKLLDDNSSP